MVFYGFDTTLEIIFNFFLNFVFFSCFVYLLPSFVAIRHILRAEVWLFGFEKVFWQVLIDFFCLLSICCPFLT